MMNTGLGGSYVQLDAQERVMRDNCPKCGSSDVVPRTVNDRLRGLCQLVIDAAEKVDGTYRSGNRLALLIRLRIADQQVHAIA
jgi:hypothetical protein